MSETKLPIDEASYPRRTKMSVTPLRKCKKSLNTVCMRGLYLQVTRVYRRLCFLNRCALQNSTPLNGGCRSLSVNLGRSHTAQYWRYEGRLVTTEGTMRNVTDTGADPLRRCALLQFEHVIRQGGHVIFMWWVRRIMALGGNSTGILGSPGLRHKW